MTFDMTFEAIAHIESCYPERFGIPRQAGLVPSAPADIVFAATEFNKLAVRGLEQCSHLWVVFIFHDQPFKTAKPLVQPPRLGGRKTMGVYATRSPNRPNPIGLSVVELVGITTVKRTLRLRVRGGDFLDGTPVLDIKPYIPYADAIATATTWAAAAETRLPVRWSDSAIATLYHSYADESAQAAIQCLIAETIAQDPRPAHERGKDGNPGQEWNLQVQEFSVFWTVAQQQAIITRLVKKIKVKELGRSRQNPLG
ncbi:MAG: tRNA (N6-threonylcarbamoyladenosine(37)-N6)-methyltransferase TrmO [Cyanothece sp. SIO2G6]|nr:tRNA (N6-threonylcarbamoyladenosine(37)-N6)-methyltransferase TrmO [Cyanothece sp. SIO2G6]